MKSKILVLIVVIGSVGGSIWTATAFSHQAAKTHQVAGHRSRRTSTSAVRTATVPARCPRVGRYEPVDPRRAQPLPPNGLTLAVEDALGYFQMSQSPVEHGAVAMGAQRDPSSAVYWCGRRIASRTVEVQVSFPRAPSRSASLSTGRVLVSRFSGRYAVWLTLHG